MKTAEEIKSIQENAIRSNLENKLIQMAQNCYVSYTCRSTECPEWLQKELMNKGFKIQVNDNVENFGVKITW